MTTTFVAGSRVTWFKVKTPSARALRLDLTPVAPTPIKLTRTGVVRDMTGRTSGPDVEKSNESVPSSSSSEAGTKSARAACRDSCRDSRRTGSVLVIDERSRSGRAVLDVDAQSSGKVALAHPGQAGRHDLQCADRPLAKA